MRTLKILTVAAVAALAVSPAAVAQQAKPYFFTEQQPGEKLSDSYIGASVVARSSEGLENVGKVTDLLLSDSNKVVGVVVDIGGFLGVGAKPVGLSWTALSEEQSDGELLLLTNMTREELEAAPAFKTIAEKQVEQDRKMMEEKVIREEPTPPTPQQVQ
ncbi:PRC-barrel domain-containing protein [Pelagibius marinus]|uniref:PRC-barrel domain-containing protein n=1 Tax=Pelagibius marinus TaxID=2762760 RepID=UPI001872D545|nr:PRC-barrel domain-containing protein [Pelagibius marinus]